MPTTCMSGLQAWVARRTHGRDRELGTSGLKAEGVHADATSRSRSPNGPTSLPASNISGNPGLRSLEVASLGPHWTKRAPWLPGQQDGAEDGVWWGCSNPGSAPGSPPPPACCRPALPLRAIPSAVQRGSALKWDRLSDVPGPSAALPVAAALSHLTPGPAGVQTPSAALLLLRPASGWTRLEAQLATPHPTSCHRFPASATGQGAASLASRCPGPFCPAEQWAGGRGSSAS